MDLLIRGPEFYFKYLTRLSFWKSVQANVRDKYGRTLLLYAAWNGYMAIVERLVKAKARVDSKDEIGKTLITYALYIGDGAVVNKLMKETPDDLVDVIRGALLISAAIKGHTTIVERLLLEKGANIEAVNGYWTLLLAAVRNTLGGKFLLVLYSNGGEL